MKATLIKTIDNGWPKYSLRRADGKMIATTRFPFDEPALMIAKNAGIELQKLSKQNCNEIFGVVNVERLAIEHSASELSMYPETSSTLTESEVLRLRSVIQAHSYRGFEKGFNKAMQLNATKVFTLEQMSDCWNAALKFQETELSFAELIMSLQPPKEIEVEVEMDILNEYDQPKLDSDGCLILKKPAL